MLLTVIPAVIVGISLGVTKMEGYGTEQLWVNSYCVEMNQRYGSTKER